MKFSLHSETLLFICLIEVLSLEGFVSFILGFSFLYILLFLRLRLNLFYILAATFLLSGDYTNCGGKMCLD